MNTMKVYTQDGDVVINLVDVEVMEEMDFYKKFESSFTAEELDILSELVFEGDIVEDFDQFDGGVLAMKYDDYVSNLKQYCDDVING